MTGARPGSSRKWSHPRGASGESRTLAQARPGLRRREDALGTGGAFRDGPNCLLRVLSCKRLLSRSLSFDALVFLLVPTSYVSFPQVRSHATCDGYGLAGALWQERRCAGRSIVHVTTTQLPRVTPFVVWTERWMTVEDPLRVALALPVDDDLCVTCPAPVEDDPFPNPISANSDKRINRSAT